MGERDGSALALTLWLDAVPRPGWLNMAIDLALLERAAGGEAWLRLYAWSPSCLSFGRHEPATRRYDRERIAALDRVTLHISQGRLVLGVTGAILLWMAFVRASISPA